MANQTSNGIRHGGSIADSGQNIIANKELNYLSDKIHLTAGSHAEEKH